MEKKKPQRKSNRFTLLEIMVTLVILGLVAGLIGTKVYDLIDESRFQSSVKRLYSKLETLQILALVLQCEVKVKVTKDFVNIVSDEPFLQHEGRFALAGVTAVKRCREFEILSTGRIEPSDMIVLAHGQKEMWIDFSTPLQIKLLKACPKPGIIPIPLKPKEEHAPDQPSV